MVSLFGFRWVGPVSLASAATARGRHSVPSGLSRPHLDATNGCRPRSPTPRPTAADRLKLGICLQRCLSLASLPPTPRHRLEGERTLARVCVGERISTRDAEHIASVPRATSDRSG